ncbi:MAG TPA: PLP-dependent aminotransferase family protein [Bradyrhizobium sp.]|nr:PLP-dependent aminotransferase family protein [Bradyrhizobium sp.]
MANLMQVPDWLPTIESGTSVKYTSIVDAITKAVESGSLPEGARLPPHRELAGLLGVTVATVTKAITDLNRKGLLASRRGSGTFVRSPNANRSTSEDAAGPKDLAVNRPAVGPVAHALAQALNEVRLECGSELLFGYEPAGGSVLHRRAGSLWLAGRGIEATDDHILVTPGANDGLLAALATVTRPGATVLCEAVNYAGLRRIAHLLGLSLVGVPIDVKGMIPAALADACKQHRPHAVICTPVTHNPTGASLDAERRRELANVVRREKIVLIEDDINGHLGATEPETLFSLAPEQTIYVTSMSKCLSAGLRVGFMTASPGMMAGLRDSLYSTNWTAPSLHAAIASRLIVTGMAEQCVADQRQEAAARMALVHTYLGKHAVSDGPSYHAWIELDRSIRPEELCVQLLKAGIMVSPAHHFAVPGSPVPNAIRIGLGGVEARVELEDCLRVVGSYLAPQTRMLGAIA